MLIKPIHYFKLEVQKRFEHKGFQNQIRLFGLFKVQSMCGLTITSMKLYGPEKYDHSK